MKSPPYETVGTLRVHRLYRYERFVEGHLISTLSGRVYFSKAGAFNDPWDCKPWFNLPADPAGGERLIQWFDQVARKRDPHPDEALRARQIEELRTNPEKLRKSIEGVSESIGVEMERRYRVYCLTTKPACPLMWAHYADKHHGICLELDVWKQDLVSAIKVQYRETYPTFSLNEHNDISPFYTKSAEWQYEHEYRLIAEEEGDAFSDGTLKTRDGFYMLPDGALKSVIIGALATDTVRRQIKSVVQRINPAVVVRQATCMRDRYQLAIEPPLEMEGS
jgi:Protein of unknown function (DUF2971)